MNPAHLTEPEYSLLSQPERETLLAEIATETKAASFQYATFNRFGRGISTAIFDIEGSEFVFVPGATITLGWDGFNSEPQPDMWLDLAEGFEHGTDDEILDTAFSPEFRNQLTQTFLANTTPRKEFTIPPMLVERTAQNPCWREVALDTLPPDSHVHELIRAGEADNVLAVTAYQNMRVSRADLQAPWRVELFDAPTFAQLNTTLETSGFSLPTMREWEYLAGGGCATLAPWGDSIDVDSIMATSATNPNDRPRETDAAVKHVLSEPNFFGLTIAFDPYHPELVHQDDSFTLKGGDGGNALCGGAGIAWGFFPVTPYFMDYLSDTPPDPDQALVGDEHYRRVKPLAVGCIKFRGQ